MFVLNDTKEINRLVFAWLKNGIYALAIAGIYSIILVILRTPQISHFIDNKDLFKSALIVHVNLSVLVWLMSITALFWSYNMRRFVFDNVFARVAFVGLALMSIGPFVGESTPIMNNYVPMLENLVFIIGLSLFGVATLFFAVTTFVTSLFDIRLLFGIEAVSSLLVFKLTSSLMYVMVWLCFAFSYLELEDVKNIVPIDLDFYYELLYWSGGHLLQFIYTQSFIMALILLFEVSVGTNLRFAGVYNVLFVINFVLALAVFYGHANFEIIDGAFKEYYTLHMIYTAGIVPIIFVITVLLDYFTIKNEITKNETRARNILSLSVILSSLLLFGAGGFIGAYISGVNVTIPAHYHGSVVGISVAFMGIAYLYCYYDNFISDKNEIIRSNKEILSANLSPYFSYKSISYKPALYQLGVFTFGQIMHISGLALAGGYGVMRKSPGVEIPLSAKLYMGMVGGGGLLAIIGGLMFVWICAKKLQSI